MDCVTTGSVWFIHLQCFIESLDYHWIVLLLDHPSVALNPWIINGLCETTGLSMCCVEPLDHQWIVLY